MCFLFKKCASFAWGTVFGHTQQCSGVTFSWFYTQSLILTVLRGPNVVSGMKPGFITCKKSVTTSLKSL